MKNTIPILMYHGINDKSNRYSFSKIDSVYSITEELFEEQMSFISNNNFTVLSIHDLISLKEKNKDIPDKSLVITFDDGHESNYTVGYPILKKFKFPADIFITTNYIDKKNYLKKHQIIAMHNERFSIHSHMVDHKYFPNLPYEEKNYQLSKSKEILENIIKGEVNYVSLPGGRLDNSLTKMLEKNGYKGACTSIPGYNKVFNSYLIQRIPVKKNLNIQEFKKIIFMDYIYLFKIKLIYYSLFLIKKSLGNRKYDAFRSIFMKQF